MITDSRPSRLRSVLGSVVPQFRPHPVAAVEEGGNAAGDPLAPIIACVAVLRGRLVIWDTDLAELYGLSRARLVDSVCLAKSLPGDFWFQPDREEVVAHGRELPTGEKLRFVFTEHGAFVCAQYLNTPAATLRSVHIVRAFVRLRQRPPGNSASRDA